METVLNQARTSSHFVTVVAILMSILHAALAVTATIDKSPTFDDPTHLTAGYSYWLQNDFRMDSENGNFPARWAAIPLIFEEPNLIPLRNSSWEEVNIGAASKQFFYASGNNPERVLLHGRIMMSILSAALCLVVFFCARSLFGSIAGLLSEALTAFDPNLLGHGALVASDVTVALFFITTLWMTWELLHRVSVRSLILTALSVSGLFLSKMSAPLFVTMAAALIVVRMVSTEPVQITLDGHERLISTVRGKIGTIASLGLIIGFAVAISIWASFGFRFSALTENGRPREVLNERWDNILISHSPVERALKFARDFRLLPEAYLYGLAYIESNADFRPSFLNSRWSNVGFPSFFPRAFLYKTPLPVLALLGLAFLACTWRRRITSSANR
ncbi:MAG: glycosyltransferase family 39 protein [Spartobacteria bacterium]